jgi:hypothetical protein
VSDAQALCNPATIKDIVRVITPVQLPCGELPPIAPPQSSPIKAISEDQTTQLVTVWTSDDATEVVADALTRAWWPLSAAAALTLPRSRAPLAAALATKRPLQLADDLAYGIGLWQGCFAQRTLDPLMPAHAWKLAHAELS